MSFSKLNVSIRWKMLAGFLLSALFPSVLYLSGLRPLYVIILSLSVSLFFALVAISRVMGTMARIQESLVFPEVGVIDEKDELRLINESLDHFSEYFEKVQMAECEITQGIGADVKKVEKHYPGRLVTGDPVTGDLFVLPSRTSAELVTSARLVGNLAVEVFFKVLPAH